MVGEGEEEGVVLESGLQSAEGSGVFDVVGFHFILLYDIILEMPICCYIYLIRYYENQHIIIHR